MSKRVYVEFKFNPLMNDSEKVAKELEVFFSSNDVELKFSGPLPQKGDFVMFFIEDLIMPEGYEEDFELLSENAKNYFEDLCSSNPVEVIKRLFVVGGQGRDTIYLTLNLVEHYTFPK